MCACVHKFARRACRACVCLSVCLSASVSNVLTCFFFSFQFSFLFSTRFTLRITIPEFVLKGGNVQITLMMFFVIPTLIEEFTKEHGSAPRTLYWQSDRGSDQFCITWFAAMEWLVAGGWFDVIEHCAMIVGHSHDVCSKLTPPRVHFYVLLYIFLTRPSFCKSQDY